MGAAALSLRNFVFMTGDSPKNGDHPDAKPVFDLTTLELLRTARSLREGRDMAGNELKGSRVSLSARPRIPGPRTRRLRSSTARKIDAGAQSADAGRL